MRQLKITKSIEKRESLSEEELRAIKPTTTCDEDIDLVRKAQDGDFEALEKLAEAYLGWIEYFAKKSKNQGVELPYLIEAGQRGFIKGVERFDCNSGFLFHSIVTLWIKKEINETLEAQKIIDNYDSDSMEEFLLPSAPTTTFEEEDELVRRFKEGDSEAFEILIESFRGFVVATAKQYLNQGLDLPDLVKIGRKGLVKGIMSFDEKKGFFFRSWISWNIKESILKALEDHKK